MTTTMMMITIMQEAGWATVSVWTWLREKSQHKTCHVTQTRESFSASPMTGHYRALTSKAAAFDLLNFMWVVARGLVPPTAPWLMTQASLRTELRTIRHGCRTGSRNHLIDATTGTNVARLMQDVTGGSSTFRRRSPFRMINWPRSLLSSTFDPTLLLKL